MSFKLANVGLTIGSKKNSKCLINNINLSIEPGEMTAILGPNGAGKSTVLKVMANEYLDFSGTMTLNDQNYLDIASKLRAKMVAVLPQTSQLSFSLTVLDVVMLGRLPHSTGRKYDTEVAFAALQTSDVEHLAYSHYPLLSGGEKQRVQIARVLCQIWDPPIEEITQGQRYLLLDEPTSALDLSHQHLCLSLAKQLAGKGVGVLSILHDLNLAAQYADKILLLADGEIVNQGSVQAMLTEAQISALYGIDVKVIAHPVNQHPLIVTL